MSDPVFYIIGFIALSPVFWYVGALLNAVSQATMHRHTVEENGVALEVRAHSALSSLSSLIGNLFYFAAAAGGLFVLVGVGVAAAAVILVGGTLLLIIMVPLMVGSLLMSLILEPIIARSTGQNNPPHTA